MDNGPLNSRTPECLGSQLDFRIKFGKIQRVRTIHIDDFTTWRIQEELWHLFSNRKSSCFQWKTLLLTVNRVSLSYRGETIFLRREIVKQKKRFAVHSIILQPLKLTGRNMLCLLVLLKVIMQRKLNVSASKDYFSTLIYLLALQQLLSFRLFL